MWPFGGKKEIDHSKWDEMNRMVVKLISEKKIKDAEAVAQELFNYSKDCYGKRHGNTATALNNLGFIGIMQKEFDKAESYLLMALQVTEKAYGKDSREAAVVNVNLAKLYMAKAREISAVEHAFREHEVEDSEAEARLKMRNQVQA
jgi:hypothetical protein